MFWYVQTTTDCIQLALQYHDEKQTKMIQQALATIWFKVLSNALHVFRQYDHSLLSSLHEMILSRTTGCMIRPVEDAVHGTSAVCTRILHQGGKNCATSLHACVHTSGQERFPDGKDYMVRFKALVKYKNSLIGWVFCRHTCLLGTGMH